MKREIFTLSSGRPFGNGLIVGCLITLSMPLYGQCDRVRKLPAASGKAADKAERAAVLLGLGGDGIAQKERSV